MGKLVVTRKPGEEITITCPDGNRIHIRYSIVDCRRAKICIEAPSDYIIERKKSCGENRTGVEGRI